MYYNGETLVKNINGNSENIPVPDASDNSTYVAQYVCLIEDFVERIISKQGCDDCINEAFNTTKILYKSYESARKNCTIFLD
jgi:hypothetical protein